VVIVAVMMVICVTVMRVSVIMRAMGAMVVMGPVAIEYEVQQRSCHEGLEDAVGKGVLHLVKK